ncbi:tetratricopeptide repeat protein [Dinghuibacter silviterrae]|uniref:Anaphase-promoting complex subunit 3 n=1 Tax=Dinghuibacter silviterrae TaxID=1539049 RepID=A0A4R8DP66_9BACT|nr:tetratricopeptide repeat protein [Dinghuibacter silviterrae]TDW99899.1 anaphase-promoting complex subunit 3 [Dinghuibacter silviterrae]
MNILRSGMLFGLLVAGFSLRAQSVKEELETGNSLMQGGDFSNAIAVLSKAHSQEPGNLEVVKSLAFSYYLSKDYTKALDVIKPMIDGDGGDDACFQIAGNIYVSLAQNKEAEKLYRKALKKFPDSGPLYADFGIFLGSLAEGPDAIRIWEQGIEADPSYPGNYYYASKYYYTVDLTWSILYGEVFVNMESLTRRTPEIKALLLDSYKKIFSKDEYLNPLVDRKGRPVNEFENDVRATLRANASALGGGINEESLTALRSRFVLDWFSKYATQFPYRLFDYQRQLLQQGMFTAYNQWIFGSAEDEKTYNSWVSAHNDEFNTYYGFARGRVFKIPKGQYYQTKEKE